MKISLPANPGPTRQPSVVPGMKKQQPRLNNPGIGFASAAEHPELDEACADFLVHGGQVRSESDLETERLGLAHTTTVQHLEQIAAAVPVVAAPPPRGFARVWCSLVAPVNESKLFTLRVPRVLSLEALKKSLQALGRIAKREAAHLVTQTVRASSWIGARLKQRVVQAASASWAWLRSWWQ